MNSLNAKKTPICTECDFPEAQNGSQNTRSSKTPRGCGQPRTVTKAGADLEAFETLVTGWNELRWTELPLSDGGEALESRAFDGQRVEPGTPENGVEALLHLITRDARRISERVVETRRQLMSLEMDLDGARARERTTAISFAKDLIRRYAVSPKELAFGNAEEGERTLGASAQEGGPSKCGAAPKSGCFRGPSGEIWFGRGRHPAWLKRALDCGGQLSDYWLPAPSGSSSARSADVQEVEHG